MNQSALNFDSRVLANLREIQDLVRLGAIFYVSHSGGKDSQAMYIAISKVVPFDQIRVIHADLGDLEHPGTYDHIISTVATNHAPIVARSVNQAGEEIDLFDMVRNRRASLDAKGRYDAPAFPSSAQRFCTSDLKTGPIWKKIRNDDHCPDYEAEQRNGKIVVNCVGIRADESKSRMKKVVQRGTLNLNKKNTNGKRDAYDWWPIAHWTDQEVFEEIYQADQEPHSAYGHMRTPNGHHYTTGNERLSCMFCIFGSRNDLRRAKEQSPELYQRYIDLEIEVRSTMFNGESLADRCA